MTRYTRSDTVIAAGRRGFQVTWALLPVLWWRDVAVVTKDERSAHMLDLRDGVGRRVAPTLLRHRTVLRTGVKP